MNEISVGESIGELRVRITRQTLVRYAGASNDFNEIHYRDRYATAIGLPGVVAHGMWTMGAAIRVVTHWCQDPARIRSYKVRFSRPIVVPDDDEGVEVTFAGVISAITEDVVTISITVTCGDEAVLSAASAEVSR